MSHNPSAGSVETANLPFGKTTIMGVDYGHFNVDGSMLDSQFVKTAHIIESKYKEVLQSRQECLKLEKWVSRLCDNICCERVPLLKNRNAYIKLLLKSLQELGRLEGIFKKMPPHDGQELLNLQKH